MFPNSSSIREVFVSYHSKSSKALAEKVCQLLEQSGVSCWYAGRDLKPGDDFASIIPPQIAGCRVFLLLVNEFSIHSKHVENELSQAFSRLNKGEDFVIIPIQTDACKLVSWSAYYLSNIQILKMNSLEDDELFRVVNQVVSSAKAYGDTLRYPKSQFNSESLPTLEQSKIKGFGSCGESVSWELDSSGLLTIFGYGEVDYHDTDTIVGVVDNPWKDYIDSISSVKINRGVTDIGEWSFFKCKNLTNISVEDSVTRIGSRAFYHCSSLDNVKIPEGVTIIEDLTFDSCKSLTSITIPSKVKSIEKSAFERCTNLKVVVILGKLTRIGEYAFCNCSNTSFPICGTIESSEKRRICPVLEWNSKYKWATCCFLVVSKPN